MKFGPFTNSAEPRQFWVKVVNSETGTAAVAHASTYHEAQLRTAIQLRATIAHPGVPSVLHVGKTDPDHPWLRGGTYYISEDVEPLAEDYRVQSWAILRDHLVDMLRVLRAAHSAGVYHGRLGFESLFVRPSNPKRLVIEGWLLARYSTPDGTELTGFTDDRQDWGPALAVRTDLYGLGMTAAQMILGDALAPQGVPKLAESLRKLKTSTGLPIRFPKGFLNWLSALLERDPLERPSSASEALNWLLEVDRLRRPVAGVGRSFPPPVDAPKARYRAPAEGLTDARLAQLPILDRDEEMAELWRHFRRATEGRMQIVLVKGASGVGKTTLLRWLGRAVMSGAHGNVLGLAHPEMGESLQSIGGALAEAWRLNDLDPATLRRRSGQVLANLGLDDTSSVQLFATLCNNKVRLSPEQGRDVAIHLLGKLSAVAPLLVNIDDLQWGSDSIDIISELAKRPGRRPMLIVGSIRRDALVERASVEQRIDELRRLGVVTEIEVKPLSDKAIRQLALDHFGFAPNSAELMSQAVAGNPMVASLWADSALSAEEIEYGPDGIELPKSVIDAIPRAHTNLFVGQLERTLASGGPCCGHSARTAVLALAVVSDSVPSPIASKVMRAATDACGDTLLDQLQTANILRVEGGRVGFVHALMRDAILRDAEGRDELTKAQRLAADTLKATDNGANSSMAESLINILVDLGEPEEALGYLWSLIDERLALNKLRAIGRHLTRAKVLMLSVGDKKNAPVWAQYWLRMSDTKLQLGQVDLAKKALAKAIAAGCNDKPSKDRRQLIEAMILAEDDAKAASDALSAFIDRPDPHPNPITRGRAVVAAVRLMLDAEETRRPVVLISQCLEELSDFDVTESALRAQALRLLARLRIRMGKPRDAMQSLLEAARLDNTTGNQESLYRTLARIAYLSVASKEPELAKTYGNLAAQNLSILGSSFAFEADIARAFHAQMFRRADDVSEGISSIAADQLDREWGDRVSCLRVWLATLDRDWDGLREAMKPLAASSRLELKFDLNAARCLDDAGRRCFRYGEKDLGHVLTGYALETMRELRLDIERSEMQRRIRLDDGSSAV